MNKWAELLKFYCYWSVVLLDLCIFVSIIEYDINIYYATAIFSNSQDKLLIIKKKKKCKHLILQNAVSIRL
jgi:hypothetical protein